MNIERLKKMRVARKLKQEYIANIVGVNRATYSNWEAGRRLPDVNYIAKIADFFETSVDYLLGRTNNPHIQLDMPNMKQVLERELTWDGVPMTDEEIKPIRDLFEIVFRDRLPKSSPPTAENDDEERKHDDSAFYN